MRKDSPEKLILIGKVVRPHGVEGILKIKSYAHSEESFLHAGSVFLKPCDQEPDEFKVLSIKPHKSLFLLRLSGIDSIEMAERYRNADISIREQNLNRKDPDEYFWYELKGLDVFLITGEPVGRVKDIIPTGSNDIFVVKTRTSEVLIPALHDVVKSIDLENGKIIISDVKGLLDLNEI